MKLKLPSHKSSSSSTTSTDLSLEIIATLDTMNAKLKSMKNLMAATLCIMEKVHESTKKIEVHVAKLKIMLDQVTNKAIKLFENPPTKVSYQFKEFYGVAGTKLKALQNVVANTFGFFLQPH